MLRLAGPEAALQLQGLFEEGKVCEVLRSAHEFPTGVDPLERQDGHLGLKPSDFLGVPIFVMEAAEPVHFAEKVHCRAILQIHHRVRALFCTEPLAEVDYPQVSAGGQVDPDVSVERGGRGALQDGAAHACYLKPYFFLAERVYKSCERRKFSCRRQRSSGVAARLRANKYLSSSLKPGTRRILLSIRTTFFCPDRHPPQIR